MRHPRFLTVALLALLAFLALPATSPAQDANTFRVGVLGGLGGSLEDEPDTGLDNFGLQALFTMQLDTNTRWGARLGQIGLDFDDGPALSADLTYLTLSGEYTFPAGFYESGIYLGLGLYDFAGDAPLADETAVGLVLGVSGDFRLTDHFTFLVELSGHYADLDTTQFFALAHVGVAYHF